MEAGFTLPICVSLICLIYMTWVRDYQQLYDYCVQYHFVTPIGFEPMTPSLGNLCSIH